MDSQPNEKNMVYASVWRRIGAKLIDGMCMMSWLSIMLLTSGLTRWNYVYWTVPEILLEFWFYVYLVIRYGGTPGKLALDMRITMLNSSPVTLKAAVLRYSVDFVFGVVMMIATTVAIYNMTDEMYFSLGYVERQIKIVEMLPSWYGMIGNIAMVWNFGNLCALVFHRKHRALHDFIGRTVVIRPVPAEKTVGWCK